jgi:hypothetical protein
MVRFFLLLVIVSPMDSIYQSKTKFSSTGLEYKANNNIQLLSTKSIQTKMLCSVQCNQLFSCRIFDYDSVSKRCRLFEGDSTTGSIISSSSSTSVVGTIEISSNLYSSVYNQPCQSCQQDRYEVCSNTTNRYQCPDHTYWNGVVCALQLFENQTCGMLDSCRSDLNLTCLTDCYGYSTPKCLLSGIYIKNTISSSI